MSKMNTTIIPTDKGTPKTIATSVLLDYRLTRVTIPIELELYWLGALSLSPPLCVRTIKPCQNTTIFVLSCLHDNSRAESNAPSHPWLTLPATLLDRQNLDLEAEDRVGHNPPRLKAPGTVAVIR